MDGMGAGLLDNPDYLKQLQDALSQMGPNDADKATAKNMGLLSFGLSALANVRKPTLMGVGEAGQTAVNQYQEWIKQQQAMRGQNMQNLGALDALRQSMGARQAMVDMYKQSGMPGATQAPPQVSMGPPDASGDGSPQTAPSGIAPLGSASGGMATKAQMAESYQRYGMGMAARGFPDQATKYFDIAEKMRPVLDKTQTLINPTTGERQTVNIYKDGTTSVVPYAPDTPDLSFHDTGQVLQPFNPKTGQPVGQGTPLAPSIGQAETQRHNLVTEGSPDAIEASAQAIAGSQLPPLEGNALRTPYGQNVMRRVLEVNPQYSAIDYHTAQKAVTAFATGPQGDAVRAISVANNHVGTLMPLIGALNSGDVQALNKAAIWYKTQTGQSAPTDFNGIKSIVADEVVKAVVGGASALGDREKIDAAFNNVNSPAQLKSLVQKYQLLMGGQLEGLQRQYKASTGRADFTKLLSAESQSQMPNAAPSAAPANLTVNRTALVNAQQAIKRGADPAAVKARLMQAGVDPSGL